MDRIPKKIVLSCSQSKDIGDIVSSLLQSLECSNGCCNAIHKVSNQHQTREGVEALL
jgi:hypothetical protein